MGRIIACKKCGAWVEIQARPTGPVFCEKCQAAEGLPPPIASTGSQHEAVAPGQAVGLGQPATLSSRSRGVNIGSTTSGGDAGPGAAEIGSRPAGDTTRPRAGSGRGITIGPEVGEIGSTVHAQTGSLLEEQTRRMQANLDALQINPTAMEEVGRRLDRLTSQGLELGDIKIHAPRLPTAEEVAEYEPGDQVAASKAEPLPIQQAGQVAERAGRIITPGRQQAARQEAARLRQEAGSFAREQAHKTIAEAQQLAQEKGLGAVREADDFVRQQRERIMREAKQKIDAEVKQAADRAAKAGREAVDRLKPRASKRVDIGSTAGVTGAAGAVGVGAAKASAGSKPQPVKPLPVGQPKPPTQPVQGGHAGQREAAREAGWCDICATNIVVGDQVTRCLHCKKSYHADCFKTWGGCSSPGCLGADGGPEGRIEPGPTLAKPVPMAKPVGTMRLCPGCGVAVPKNALHCPSCNRWLYSGRGADQSAGRPDSSSQPQAILKNLPAGCIFMIILAVLVFLTFIASAIGH